MSGQQAVRHFHALNDAYTGDPKETTYRTRAGAVAMIETWQKVAKSFGFSYEMRNGVLKVTERNGRVVYARVEACTQACELRLSSA